MICLRVSRGLTHRPLFCFDPVELNVAMVSGSVLDMSNQCSVADMDQLLMMMMMIW